MVDGCFNDYCLNPPTKDSKNVIKVVYICKTPPTIASISHSQHTMSLKSYFKSKCIVALRVSDSILLSNT